MTLEQQLDTAPGRPSRTDARLDDPRVVEHDKIAVSDEARKIRKREIFAPLLIHVQQPAVAASYSGRLRDELRRQFVIEVG